MAITYSPKVGEVLECNFGDFQDPLPVPHYNGLIQPEIRKRRLVVVLNGKLPNNCVIVVPISSSKNQNAEDRGYHVAIPTQSIPVTGFYDCRERWAICECVTHVSKERLFPVRDGANKLTPKLDPELVTKIHRALIRTVNANALLSTPVEKGTEKVEASSSRNLT